ncbi:hypothetical protein [Mycoplasma sp. HU2014]|uniref:hypothetical protein n=1 Tax=Mycoplasma sp. HU2014 TaxID=1664275 RepID=UPI00067B324A|nr:hypothetical protein [Mycoplasma sp. HU2014]
MQNPRFYRYFDKICKKIAFQLFFIYSYSGFNGKFLVNFVNIINKVEGLVDKDTSEINDFKNYKKQILRELANSQFWVTLSRDFLSGVAVALTGGGIINQIFKRYVKLPSVGVAIETAAEASDKVAQLRTFASFVAKVNLELFAASSIAIAGRLVKAASSFNSAIDEIKKVNLEE